MGVGQWLALIGLTCAAFVVNTSEFMPIGLLTDIAASFDITESTAGVMISVYAWGVMLFSLPLMVLASRLEFKRLLLLVMALFAAGQFFSAMAPNFVFLVVARLLVAAAHAVFWSVVSVIATRLVDATHGALALSMVATGSSLAQIFGLPLGRAIGLAVGWRMTFSVVGAIAAAIAVYLLFLLPRLAAGERFELSELPRLLRNPVLLSLYMVTVCMATGYYVGYSYIEPFLQQVAHFDPSMITASLTVFGCAGLVGSVLFSRFYDGHRYGFVFCMLFGVAASLALMRACSMNTVAVFALCALWGLCATAFNVAFQAQVIAYAEPAQSAVAMSIFSGLFNLGIGCGTAAGGAVVARGAISSIGYVGAVIAFAGVAVCVLVMFRAMRRATGQKSLA